MKIVAFSINPLFAHKINGGSPKHLQNVVVHLGELGHEVTVLCTRHPDNGGERFSWHPQVTVYPILPFHQPFPQPYAIPAFQLADIIQTVGDHLQDADRFYMHDGELLFPPVYDHIPTVVSLRDNVYPETILGSFLFRGDRLIAIADYSRQIYLQTAGRFLPDLPEKTITINNGIDFNRFRPGSPAPDLAARLPVDPQRDRIILHPHRPEPSKGLAQTVAVADLLVHRYGIHNLKVLVPTWFDAQISAEVRAYYADIEQQIADRGLTSHFVFHDWIPQSQMHDYYRLGDLTLVLGHFVEAFGNVAYESLACGTPAIVARVATHRSLLPDELLPKVHFGDNETAAAIAADILREKRGTPPATMAYLHEHFTQEQQLAGYAQAIQEAEKRPSPRPDITPLTDDTRYTLATWCYEWKGGFYHDFTATHTPIPDLSELLATYEGQFSQQEALAAGITAAQLQQWSAAGYLVPTRPDASREYNRRQTEVRVNGFN